MNGDDGIRAHSLAVVESGRVGARTRVWAWAHILDGAAVGSDCNIGEHCYVESGAHLGDRVTVKNGVAIWDGVTVEDDVFLGPGAVLTNDPRPRSRNPDFRPTPTRLGRGCSIGAGAVILCGITVGEWAMVGAGSVVTRDVPPHALVFGNPARIRGRVCRCGRSIPENASPPSRCECG